MGPVVESPTVGAERVLDNWVGKNSFCVMDMNGFRGVGKGLIYASIAYLKSEGTPGNV